MLFVIVSTMLLTACSGGGGSDSESESNSGAGAPAAQPHITAVKALSKHRLLATFDKPPNDTVIDPDDYRIVTSDDTLLPVTAIAALGDGNQALVSTGEPLRAASYRLTYTPDSSQSQPTTLAFDGSTISEPTLVDVEIIDLKNLRVTYSEPMSKSAEKSSAYLILNTAAQDEAVPIASAEFGETPAQIVLTTDQPLQESVDYRMVIGDIRSQNGVYLNPTENTREYNSDITPPRLVSAVLAGNTYRTRLDDDPPPAFLDAVAKGDTAVLLTFSEPVGQGAENTDNYALTPDTPIDSALLTKDKTQVVLLTGRLFDEQYQIDVSNVQDLRGQLISPGARIAQFDGQQTIEGVDTSRPRVVTAGAGDNNTVYVTFSKPMNSNAEDPDNYSIVQENVNSEVGGVGVIGAQFYNGERLTVQLTTRSQNEVSYRVMVSRVTDLGGRPLADRERGVDPTSVVFAGVPPGSSELVDNDNDGLPDNQETRGHEVTLQLPDGSTQTVQVTSDPDNPDTDGDGVNDAEELEYGSNPRSADTDGDSLGDDLELNTILSNPFAKDTDGDSLDDGLEYFVYKTSPLLADTDGDQLSDDTELFELNRDPLIADIPEVDINVGDVRLQIDERYTSTDETGKTVSEQSDTTTTLARSDDTSFARSDSGTTEISAGFEAGFEAGNGAAFGAGDATAAALPAGKAFGSANFQHTSTDSWAVNTSSARQSRQAYENSLNKGQQLFNNQTVARQVVGARIDVDLNVENTGTIPFTLSNLEVTVLRPSPIDSQRLVPVATLVSNSQLITGTPLQINLGGFNKKAGPFLFANDEVFPNAVEELMRDPGGLVFEVANYDLSDELGRNFVFANQTARDRTVSITIDSGDVEPAQTQRVATSGVLDDDGVTSPNPAYLGGFDAAGRAQGLTLDYILQARLGLKRYDRSLDVINPGRDGTLDSTKIGDDVRATQDGIDVIAAGPDGRLQSVPGGDDLVTNPDQRDGIVAGPDKTADSFAEGDDLQVVAPNTTGLSIGSIVVSPGDDGILDTLARNDDVQQFITGYETRNSCSVQSPKIGDNCLVDSDCVCQDGDDDPRCTVGAKQGGTCSGPRQLYRVNSLSNGDFNRSWYVLSNGDLPTAADFGEITAKAGTDLAISFLQDLDSDGLFARNEYLAGSVDSAIDHLNNSDFGVNFDETTAASSADGIPDSVDTDRDGLDDFAEVRVGWRVGVDGSALRRVYPIPYLRDSDGDKLLDIEEQDITGYCEQANRSENLSADASSYCSDFPPAPPVDKKDAIAILAGPNRKLDSGNDTDGDGAVDTVNDDDVLQLVDFDTNGDGQVDDADRGLGARAIVVTAGRTRPWTPRSAATIFIFPPAMSRQPLTPLWRIPTATTSTTATNWRATMPGWPSWMVSMAMASPIQRPPPPICNKPRKATPCPPGVSSCCRARMVSSIPAPKETISDARPPR